MGDFITLSSDYRSIEISALAKPRGKTNLKKGEHFLITGSIESEPDLFEKRLANEMLECMWVKIHDGKGNFVPVIAYKEKLGEQLWKKMQKIHIKKNKVQLVCKINPNESSAHSFEIHDVEFF